jgi:hypothetical protein
MLMSTTLVFQLLLVRSVSIKRCIHFVNNIVDKGKNVLTRVKPTCFGEYLESNHFFTMLMWRVNIGLGGWMKGWSILNPI